MCKLKVISLVIRTMVDDENDPEAASAKQCIACLNIPNFIHDHSCPDITLTTSLSDP